MILVKFTCVISIFLAPESDSEAEVESYPFDYESVCLTSPTSEIQTENEVLVNDRRKRNFEYEKEIIISKTVNVQVMFNSFKSQT